jgi:hypothetical protein
MFNNELQQGNPDGRDMISLLCFGRMSSYRLKPMGRLIASSSILVHLLAHKPKWNVQHWRRLCPSLLNLSANVIVFGRLEPDQSVASGNKAVCIY